MKINKISCTFVDKNLESEYQENKWDKIKNYTRNIIIVMHILFIPAIIDDFRLLGLIPTYIFVQVFSFILTYTILFSKKLRKKYYRDYFLYASILSMLNGAFHYYFYGIPNGITFPVGVAVVPMVIFIFFVIHPINFLDSLTIVVFSAGAFTILLLKEGTMNLYQLGYLVVIPFVYGVFVKWTNENTQRLYFIKDRQVQEERSKIEKLKNIELNRQKKELEAARLFQINLLPTEMPKMMNYDISAYIKTADEVGGDYYDFFYSNNDNTTTAVLGDATGHGMVAGNIVSITKSALNSLNIDDNIDKILLKLNNTIRNIEIGRNRMSLTILRLNNDNFEIASSAMPTIFYYKRNINKLKEINISGLPLGTSINSKFKVFSDKFEKDDIIVLMSDGLPEAINPDQEILGYDAITKTLNKSVGKSSDEIIRSLKTLGSEWLKGYSNQDDISMLVIKKIV